MKRLALLLFIFFSVAANRSFAQTPLPQFSVRNMGNSRILVEWTNTFEVVKQISIQRSFDSLKNFKTILTVPDPTLPANGYMDTKAPNDHMYYRLYILLDKGFYLFSDIKRPRIDTALSTLPDSLRNTVFFDNPQQTDPSWLPSRYVYTLKDGYVNISLPDEPNKKYAIKFFTPQNELLFELKELKERSFKIDKANFYRSGWFRFELYENGDLKERNRFYLPKEF